jgi:flagellar biogenesis protein FliO
MNKIFINKTNHLASKEDLGNAKTDMIKCFVGLCIALALMIIGLYVKS